MRPQSTHLKTFRNAGLEIIEKNGEILILVVYPFSAGAKDFYILKSAEEFLTFLGSRSAKELIILFKSFTTIKHGKVTKDFIKKSIKELPPLSDSDWLTIFPNDMDKAGIWHFDENKEELVDTLNDHFGQFVRILEEPNWQNEKLILKAYVPDVDGVVRPGVY